MAPVQFVQLPVELVQAVSPFSIAVKNINSNTGTRGTRKDVHLTRFQKAQFWEDILKLHGILRQELLS